MKYPIMIEEKDWDGQTTDFFEATDWQTDEPYIYDTLDEAVNHVVQACGFYAPFSGKHTFHVYEVQDDGTVRDIPYEELNPLLDAKYEEYMKGVTNA